MAVAAALTLGFATPALADKVVVLPFSSVTSGGASAEGASPPTKAELESVRALTREAVAGTGHTLATDSETLSATMAIRDGVPDTSDEYRAAGRASGAAWTLTGHVERIDVPASSANVAATATRLEVEACQVDTGRVESLARNLDGRAAQAQIQEMLALLLRPQGIANADLSFLDRAPVVAPPAPAPSPSPSPTAPVAEHATPTPAAPAPESAKAHVYGEDHPIALGLSVGLSGALARPSQARGSSLALPVGVVAGVAPSAALPGLEFRGMFTTQLQGPRAIAVAAGARYAIPIVPQHRLYVGPELLVGAHVTLGAAKVGRLLTQGSAFIALGVTDQAQLELAGDLSAALGGSSSLLLGGITARALARF